MFKTKLSSSTKDDQTGFKSFSYVITEAIYIVYKYISNTVMIFSSKIFKKKYFKNKTISLFIASRKKATRRYDMDLRKRLFFVRCDFLTNFERESFNNLLKLEWHKLFRYQVSNQKLWQIYLNRPHNITNKPTELTTPNNMFWGFLAF
jgi:hypothetical protein